MDVPTAAIANALRIGVQIVITHKRPIIEIYYHLRNVFGPEHELDLPGATKDSPSHKHKIRLQDIFVQFTASNIGGSRATNIRLSLGGAFASKTDKDDFGGVFRNEIPTMAPGQTTFLFMLRQNELYTWPEGGGKPTSVIDEPLRIEIGYDGPIRLGNILSPAHLRKRLGRKMYTESFTFVPATIIGDLPPPEYTV